jgi:hypothetical protein
MKGFETHHRFGDFFNETVILFHRVRLNKQQKCFIGFLEKTTAGVAFGYFRASQF